MRFAWDAKIPKAFGEYSGYVANLGDRVKHFFTINEVATL